MFSPRDYQIGRDREPGEEEEPKPSTNGSPRLEGFHQAIRRSIRWIDDTGRAMGLQKSVLFKDIQDVKDQFYEAVMRCFKQAEPTPVENSP
jgi:hypothetical protein